jgi:eukaryotic-like serine/threonine-protein kinase
MRARLSGSFKQIAYTAAFSITLLAQLTGCSSQATQPPAASTPTAASVPATATATQAPTAAPTVVPTDTAIPPTDTPAPTATPALGKGSTRTSDIDSEVQVYVPAGDFLMGAAHSDTDAQQTSVGNGRAYEEIPQFTYHLDNYWIDKFEVTNGQYQQCVAAGKCEKPWVDYVWSVLMSYYGNPQYDKYPVVWVTWFQARAYCEWAGRRLPTEAEWEKAARGTDGQMYPWGNDKPSGDKANFCDSNCQRTIANPAFNDGYVETAPVGSYPAGASPYGAMDMAGNVWEWTSTLIRPYPYDANDGREDLNAPGERVWRGGTWSNGVWWLRSSVRYRSVNFYKWGVLGFRCAATPDAQ